MTPKIPKHGQQNNYKSPTIKGKTADAMVSPYTHNKIPQEKKLGYFRSYDFSDNSHPIELCEHIKIKGKLIEDDDGCEYIEQLEITCNVCNMTFILEECIN